MTDEQAQSRALELVSRLLIVGSPLICDQARGADGKLDPDRLTLIADGVVLDVTQALLLGEQPEQIERQWL